MPIDMILLDYGLQGAIEARQMTECENPDISRMLDILTHGVPPIAAAIGSFIVDRDTVGSQVFFNLSDEMADILGCRFDIDCCLILIRVLDFDSCVFCEQHPDGHDDADAPLLPRDGMQLPE